MNRVTVDTRQPPNDDDSVRPITLHLFGPLSELGAGREIIVQVSPDAHAGDAMDAAIDRLPALKPWKDRIAIADDDTYLTADTPLNQRTRLCLIPPVSGG